MVNALFQPSEQKHHAHGLQCNKHNYACALVLEGERIRGIDYCEAAQTRFFKQATRLVPGWHENLCYFDSNKNEIVNIQSAVNRGIVERFMNEYGVTADATGFNKTLKFPIDPAEIQLFGCFLSAVSHLVNRVQKQAPARYVAYSTVINVANKLNLPHKPRVAYTTPHRTIAVDLSLYGPNEHTALVQTFDQRDPHTATDSMELWSARLSEIAETAPQLYTTALVYNEDVCNISPEVLAVAKSRAHFVCPSHKSDEISDFLTRDLAS